MRLGVSFPQVELAGDHLALRDFAVAADELGYDHVLLYDHVLGASHVDREPPLPPMAYDENDPFHDPLVSFGYLAGVTSRINFVTGVLILPQRQTALVARQAADIDLLSGGRLNLGVGVGYNHVEYEALGQDFSKRGARMSEQIPYLRRLWTEDLVTFEGDFDRIDRASLVPRPRRRIPIYFGGWSERAFKRAADLADGFIFSYAFGDAAVQAWERVQELLEQNNRTADGFDALFNLHPDEGGASKERTVNRIGQLMDVGATHVTVSILANGFATVDEHIEHIAWVMENVEIPGCR
ncbi:LLM class F420-dependent oxidoreductase [Nocardioides sp. NPDC051685]|uniref:LLM class F420-dependent oxidoreductase n=1 Tax=Nocardioides sp. NPDC051685 TaxID=3364334 RepID=UPI0037A2EF6E